MPALARSRKQRVAAACDFCRRRKFGCDNRKPKCTKCTAHRKDCTFAERVPTERPSNSRIAELAAENERLRASLNSSRDSRDDTTIVLASSGTEDPADDPPGPVHTPPLPGSVVEAVSESSTRYHGPSSALHDHPQGTFSALADAIAADHVGVKSQLFAEAARQRQLELINLRDGKLCFEEIDASLGYELLQAFWNRQHHSGTLVYRPAFMRDMACRGSYFSPVLLNTMLFAAMKHPPVQLGNTSGEQACVSGMTFRRKAQDILFRKETQLLNKSSVTTAQALLVMADALFSWCDERSLSWHYLGIAISMIVDLGMHTTRSRFYQSQSAEDQEIGRRVFWSAYVADKVQSIYQGRPPRLRDIDCMVPIHFLDEYEELDCFHSLTYSAAPRQLDTPMRSTSTFEQICTLGVIAESIITTLYGEKSHLADPITLSQASKIIQTDLQRWWEALPPHLQLLQGSDSPLFEVLPHTLSLMSMYYSFIILLHRPFVSDGHLQTLNPSSTTSAFTACATAATQIHSILQLYAKHFCTSTCPYFISYATYASGTIHARIAAQKSDSPSPSRTMLRNCLEVLSAQQEKCHAPRQSLKILLLLSRKLGVDVGQFTVQRSRTDDCRADYQDEPSATSTSQTPPSFPDPFLAQSSADAAIDTDPPSLDALDMDAILRSFGPFSQDTSPAYVDATGSVDALGLASGGSEGTCYGTLERNNLVGLQNEGFSSFLGDIGGGDGFLDPLFGLEV